MSNEIQNVTLIAAIVTKETRYDGNVHTLLAVLEKI